MLNKLSSRTVPRGVQNKLDMFFEDLKAVGVSYIGHGVISESGDHSGYFSNEEWGNCYIENNYFFNEPILQSFQGSHPEMILWENVTDSHSIAQMRNKYMKLATGITICKNENGFHTFFNVGIMKDQNIDEFSGLKKVLLLAYFTVFNNYHLEWRRGKGYSNEFFWMS